MPQIKENQFFTPIIEFEVAPEKQNDFIDEITNEVKRFASKIPGFISASFHASEDGKKVINYAQWESKKHWQDASDADPNDEAHRAISNVLKKYNVEGSIGLFQVVKVIEK